MQDGSGSLATEMKKGFGVSSDYPRKSEMLLKKIQKNLPESCQSNTENSGSESSSGNESEANSGMEVDNKQANETVDKNSMKNYIPVDSLQPIEQIEMPSSRPSRSSSPKSGAKPVSMSIKRCETILSTVRNKHTDHLEEFLHTCYKDFTAHSILMNSIKDQKVFKVAKTLQLEIKKHEKHISELKQKMESPEISKKIEKFNETKEKRQKTVTALLAFCDRYNIEVEDNIVAN